MDEDTEGKGMGQVIQIDEARIRAHLGEMVRGTVEEALNAMLDAEADRLCGAARYERTDARLDTRAGHYERSLDTKAGLSVFGSRNCGARLSRPRSSSVTSGERVPSRKP